ncbi:transcriptional regulator [Rhizobium rhizosphaerae]|uniref:Ribonuclease VapC n=1 Tax=Xaviernesmea rhizosphaerae TaxID=1672749 RepID=A0A1Q9AKX1_9HYPH|nr:type II toxin-antitoxin system VapC family toxin [Xaviernesmea rhizosphaerae]OLP55953.1 transcriptional regulator [Xaviernesmea rhizosphaerae]
MLDTNIVSDLIRHPLGRVTQRIAEAGEQAVAISAIVASELRFGAAKKALLPLAQRIEGVLQRVAVLSYDERASVDYAEIRQDLESRGAPIGATDLFIAAHARALDLVLVTANTREFQRVPRLKLENWLETAP